MTAEMRPLSFEQLVAWALAERRACASVYGVPESLFFAARLDRRYETSRPFGAPISTPFGPAAGPHTQLAQNIVSAWLCGARFIELKTVQVLDRLEIPRPCIDAADEGYNVEWSQELTLDQSAQEYAHAWALVHVLPRALGWPENVDRVLFNLSVGYTLDGARSAPVQRFLDRMEAARELLDPARHVLHARFPDLASVAIPDRISSSVTLSTMHGCPPDEIERIARHLLEDRGLHVTVKLNPTLLGKERVRDILLSDLGYEEFDVPDDAFAHDLQFGACIDLVRSLEAAAARAGRRFAVKLSNTLAMRNARAVLQGDMVYMSGRALYPLTATLFAELRRALGPDLAVSYSAGADADNAAALVAAGACPVTVATDLLKPGGYGRLRQYVDRLDRAMREAGDATVDALAMRGVCSPEQLALDAVRDPRYRRDAVAAELPKVDDSLPRFDCIAAPCAAACPACQDVPTYAAHIADGNPDAALGAVLARNLLPDTTGHICTARCEERCTRTRIDRPVRIRDLKRFAAAHGRAPLTPHPSVGRRVAVVGAGPSGLAAAGYLAASGVAVTVFEARERAGGIPTIAPAFRIPRDAVDGDVARIAELGVQIETGARAPSPEDLLARGFDAVYIGWGFGDDAPLAIPGIDAAGTFGALDVLRRVAAGSPPDLGPRVLVVGGGNTAVDAARTALRLGASVSIVYRRTRAELPADREEVEDFLAEGGLLIELATPVEALAVDGHLVALDCVRNRLAEPGPDGRRRPIPDPQSRFRLRADSLLVAIGQAPPNAAGDVATRDGIGALRADPITGATDRARIYAGGDAARGPSTIIEAQADGRRAAEAISRSLGIPFSAPSLPPADDIAGRIARSRTERARRTVSPGPRRLPPEERRGFALVTATFGPDEARAEAARCLQCQLVCDRCVDVCPNRANVGLVVAPIEESVPVLDLAREARIGTSSVSIRQSRQIVHLVDLCNECGNCATFCVHNGRPFADKPRLFLSHARFAADAGPGLFVAPDGLRGRDLLGSWSLEPRGDGYLYMDNHLEVALRASLAVRAARVRAPGTGTQSAAQAIEAAVLYRGLLGSPAIALLAGRKGDAS